ncbi:hypothetical protein ACEPAH_1652 [Sanghuangporus vaninii]
MVAKFTVAICGGGVAGLSHALSIAHFSAERKDIAVDLYEAAPSFTEVGAGIVMYKRPWKVMKALGLESDLRKLVVIPTSDDELVAHFEIRKSDQTKGVTFHCPKIPFGLIAFHRAEFQQCLVNHLDPSVIRSHFSKRLMGYRLPSKEQDASGTITLAFKDGTEAQCDVLIGADGIHSTVRHAMLELVAQELESKSTEEDRRRVELLKSPGKLDPIWTGSLAYRALIPRERLGALNESHRALDRRMNYTGKNKHIISYPIMKGKIINVVAFISQPEMEGMSFDHPWVSNADKAEVIAAYEGWEAEVQQLVQCMDKSSCWAIHSMKELPICTHNRVAIIGDAVHAMSPHQGAGAGTAIEDGYILGALLAHSRTTLSTLSIALKAYESICLRHANDVQRRSRLQGQMYKFENPHSSFLAGRTISDSGDDNLKLVAFGETFLENNKWIWETVADDNLAEAISLLKAGTPSEAQ